MYGISGIGIGIGIGVLLALSMTEAVMLLALLRKARRHPTTMKTMPAT